MDGCGLVGGAQATGRGLTSLTLHIPGYMQPGQEPIPHLSQVTTTFSASHQLPLSGTCHPLGGSSDHIPALALADFSPALRRLTPTEVTSECGG